MIITGKSCLNSSRLRVYSPHAFIQWIGLLAFEASILIFFHMKKVKVLLSQSCPHLCDPLDHSLASSSVHGILQSRILKWVATPFCRQPSQPWDQTQVSYIAGRFFTDWATREDHLSTYSTLNLNFITCFFKRWYLN